MARLVVLCFLLALAAQVYSHARLSSPIAWNSNPSKSAPCGGGAAPQTATAIWKQGTKNSITWQVVAGDGVGALTATMDPNGGTQFTTNLVIEGPVPSAVTSYEFNITAPYVNCTLCTMRVASSSGWVACASIQIGTANPPPRPPTTQCITAPTLPFCSTVSGRTVAIPGGFTGLTHDAGLQASYEANLANPNVFKTPESAGCRAAYKKLICGLNFDDCTGRKKAGCSQACVNTMQYCGLDPSHYSLYNCTNIVNTVEDMTGDCNNASQLVTNMAVLVVFALLCMFMF